MLKKNLFLFSALFWTIFILVMSLINVSGIANEVKIPNADKITHFCFYFIFVVLWSAFFKIKDSNTSKAIQVTVFAIAFGILMEIFQGILTDDRTPDFFDVIANSVGAIFGLLFVTTILKKKTK